MEYATDSGERGMIHMLGSILIVRSAGVDGGGTVLESFLSTDTVRVLYLDG